MNIRNPSYIIGESRTYWGDPGGMPVGWVPEDGASYAKVDHPAAWALLYPIFGGVDADHFYVPNSLDRVIVSAGAGYAIGDTAGADTIVLPDVGPSFAWAPGDLRSPIPTAQPGTYDNRQPSIAATRMIYIGWSV